MTPSLEQVRDAVVFATLELFARDKLLLDARASEPSLTHKIGDYVGRSVAEWKNEKWDVDCEYDRHGYSEKTLVARFEEIGVQGAKWRKVRPDVIVHRRTREKENLLVIEAKKTSGSKSDEDIEKVKAFTHAKGGYHYQHGIVLRIGPEGCQLANVYREGDLVDNWQPLIQTELKKRGLVP